MEAKSESNTKTEPKSQEEPKLRSFIAQIKIYLKNIAIFAVNILFNLL